LIGLKGGEDRCSVLKEEEKLRRNGEKGSNGKMPLDYFKQTDKHEGWPIDQAKEEEKGEMEKGKIFLHNRCVHQFLMEKRVATGLVKSLYQNASRLL